MSRKPVTADDVDQAVGLAVQTLATAPEEAWDRQAGPMERSCRETAEHLSDNLFSFAVRLAPTRPHVDRGVPLQWGRPESEGPGRLIAGDPSFGPAGLLEILDAMGGLVSGMVRTRPESLRAWHRSGVADLEGFAAMAVVETLVHTYDLAQGLRLDWDPPSELCERALARLFPDAPTDEASPWHTLLWATGRVDLQGHPRYTEWQWSSAPESEL